MKDYADAARELGVLGRRLEAETLAAKPIVRRMVDDLEAHWDAEMHAEWQTIGVVDGLSAASGEVLEDDSRLALSLAQFAIALATSIPDERYPRVIRIAATADAWKALANAHRYRSEYDAALRALDAAQRLLEPEGTLAWDLGMCLFVRALLLSDMHRFDDADALLGTSEKIFRVFRDRGRRAKCLLVRGMILQRRGNVAAACTWYEKAVAAFRKEKDLASLASALHNLGDARSILDQPAQAVPALQDALSIFVELGMTGEIARSKWVLGRILAGTGRMSQARALLSEARRMFAELEMPEEAGLAGLELVEVLLALGEHHRARVLVEEVLDDFVSAKLEHRAATALAYLRQMLPTPRAAEAVQHVRRFVGTLREHPERAFVPLPPPS